MALEAHVVSHTHWDREWYLPLERFRQRLVALVDELLDDPPDSGESFLLDGQAIILEDYLEVEPERADALRALLRDGRLEAGPWYVLADELIPSGEALARNLLTGRRVLRRFGATAPPVLYCPDSFGHPAVLPSLAAGFGFPLAIVWRGYGGKRWPSGDTARWVAPNGDAVVLFHLSRTGYELGANLPVDTAESAERWRRIRDELAPRSTTGVLLVHNGADHHARQARARDAIAQLAEAGAADGVHASTLRAFTARLTERAGAQLLPQVRGELRDSYGFTWTLQGTFAARGHEKRLNARAERLLLRESEPWSALAARGGASRRALVDAAWRDVLHAHPHDTLCGCSIDAVADAMELRLRSAIVQGEGIRDDAMLDLIGHDAAEARTARARWTPVVLVRNSAPRTRSGVAVVRIEETIADVPVGPGSAERPEGVRCLLAPKPTLDGAGNIQVLASENAHARTESPRHYPDDDLVRATTAAVWLSDVPPYGLAALPIGAERPGRAETPPRPVVVRARRMENGRLAVEVGADGSVALTDVESGRRIAPLVAFVDETDRGDLYTPSLRPRDHRVEFRGVRRAHRGPLRGELQLRYRIVSARRGRVVPDVDLTVSLTLDAEAAVVRVGVRGDNRLDDHRLRIVFGTDVADGAVWADAAFGPVRREPVRISDEEARVERAAATAPLHRYLSVFDRVGGCTVFSDGLAEYEVLARGEIAVTLLRAVGELSRADLPERPGHAGWPVATPGAQGRGAFAADFAVMLHGPRLPATVDAIERAADDVLHPLVGSTLRSALGVPDPVRGVELVGSGLAFSACKESEDGEWLVLRCVNLRDEPVEGEWRLPFAPADARLARLDETPLADLTCRSGVVAFAARPRDIVTILVR